jgi:hypothetical protein
MTAQPLVPHGRGAVVPAMDQVHERAGHEQQVRQRAEHVGSVVERKGQQREPRYAAADHPNRPTR